MELSVTRSDTGIITAEFISDGRRPPILTPAVFEAMRLLADEATDNPPAGIIFTGPEGGDFQAGVDLEHMAEVSSREEAYQASRAIQLLFQRFADLPCPVVAAIEGRCIGGGTELSLACDARIAADTQATTITLPEILLGIIPGFGGTQRLPRIVGQQHALNMILTGGPVPVRQTFEQGLIDRLVEPARLRDEAARTITDLREGRKARTAPLPRPNLTDRMLEKTKRGRRMVRERYQRVVRRRTGGHLPAPEMAIRAVGLSADGTSLAEGLEQEASMLADLVTGEVHPHLLRLLRCRQAMRRPRGRDRDDGPQIDLTADLTLPEELKTTLRILVRSTSPDDSPSPSLIVPPLDLHGGFGLLRRLPAALSPVTIEVAWAKRSEALAAGSRESEEPGCPETFQDLARRFVVESGCSPVYCRIPDPSPGMELIASYLREGERLVAEGWSPDQVDETLEEWGMSTGPLALSHALGGQWQGPGSAPPPLLPGAEARTDNGLSGIGREASDRLIEEVVSALTLTMSRNWSSVDDPTEEGWTILDVFVLGGPSFRGGIIGAARDLGPEKIRERILDMRLRYGDLYTPDPLADSGPFSSVETT
ncbi:enoyl-CoA hydratase-related protein [Candidatus Zixiibacteriota bacterium]